MDVTKKLNYILIVFLYILLTVLNIIFQNNGILLATGFIVLILYYFIIKKKNVLSVERQKFIEKVFIFGVVPVVLIVDMTLLIYQSYNSVTEIYTITPYIITPFWVMYESLYFRTI